MLTRHTSLLEELLLVQFSHASGKLRTWLAPFPTAGLLASPCCPPLTLVYLPLTVTLFLGKNNNHHNTL
jgi:hypothetical protein